MNDDFRTLTPRQIVCELDKYIIGQHKAKRAVAIALRNRTRRMNLPEDLREEIAPKNILMIGPTGVGKTEIARRLAKLSHAPFLKVEATKYTEVGYVGRDVESMVRDLMAVSHAMVKSEVQEGLKGKAEVQVEERLLDLLLPGSSPKDSQNLPALSASTQDDSAKNDMSSTREKFRVLLKDGKLEDKKVEISVASAGPSFEIFAGANKIEDLESAMSSISNMMFGKDRRKRKTVTVEEARSILLAEELDKLIDAEQIIEEARRRVQEVGIIFIDEIDKVASKSDRNGGDVSREGVQRDILPIVEGSTVNTKYGMIDTRHILFIAAGAFNISKPSDLIPEFQGRFPLRVELESLNAKDFERILTEPKNALTKQYYALLSTEAVEVVFTDDAIERMSFLAAEVNARMENIGARRLHTIMETVLEDLSFNADTESGNTITIDAAYVDERLKDIIKDRDLSRYIL